MEVYDQINGKIFFENNRGLIEDITSVIFTW